MKRVRRSIELANGDRGAAVDGVFRSAAIEGLWLRPEWPWDGSRPLQRVAEVVGRERVIAALEQR